jgi:outer membrane protein assembly factor BamB
MSAVLLQGPAKGVRIVVQASRLRGPACRRDACTTIRTASPGPCIRVWQRGPSRGQRARPGSPSRCWRVVLLGGLLVATPGLAGDWPQFRGPGGTAVSKERGLPTQWGPGKNLRWKAALPGQGFSSPVVARGQVYVTACTGVLQERLHVLCFDAATGERLWERQLHATGNTLCHPKSNMAAPTPATDGERVYALFGTGDLACFSADGDLLWYRALARDYPRLSNQVGMAASPVLWKGLLLVPLETPDASLALGLDKLTGRNRWKAERPREPNWVTPLLITNGDREEVLFQSSREVTAYDPATGRKHWTYPGEGVFPVPSVPSPASGDGLVFLAGGVALRPGAEQAPPQVVWKSRKFRPAYASPLYYRGRVYAVNNTAIVFTCFDGKSGQVAWQERVEGSFSASPVAADGKVYLVNEAGVTTVFRAGDRPEILSRNELGEGVLATPALAERAIFLRSERHLYCIAAGKEAAQSPPSGPAHRGGRPDVP